MAYLFKTVLTTFSAPKVNIPVVNLKNDTRNNCEQDQEKTISNLNINKSHKNKFGLSGKKSFNNLIGRLHIKQNSNLDGNCNEQTKGNLKKKSTNINNGNHHDYEAKDNKPGKKIADAGTTADEHDNNDDIGQEIYDDSLESYENEEKDKEDNTLLPEEQCDIPTFLHTKNCDSDLIEQTRELLKIRYAKNPGSFYDHDYKRMLTDDWTVSRFLLRRRLDPKRAAKLIEECGRFRRLYKMSEVKLWEFPIEFHQAGGLFHYAPDRVGNKTVYMRAKMYRRVPEISDVFKAFILCVLEEADSANEGRGVAVIFDLSGCGLQNVDLGFLSWLLSSFRNYCPKGVSYIIVYNLPWFLNATCKLAMSWLSASNRRSLRFVQGKEIEFFIERDNLPDYLGGTCKLDYKTIPDGSKPAIEVCDRLDMSKDQALKIRELFTEYLPSENELANDEENSPAKLGDATIEQKSKNHMQIIESNISN